MKYRFVYPNGEECTKLTDAQKTALEAIGNRWNLTETITVHPMFMSDGVLVDVGSMYLGIELDGYTHS